MIGDDDQTSSDSPDADTSNASTDVDTTNTSTEADQSTASASDNQSTQPEDPPSPDAPQPVCVELTADDVQAALTAAFQAHGVPVDDDGVKVTGDNTMWHLMVRLLEDGTPLPQIPDDTSNLAPGSVLGAKRMVIGAVQNMSEATRVTMRIINVETSEILETGLGDATGGTQDSVQHAAEDAMAHLPTLGAT